MTGERITTRQARKIYDALYPTLGFLTQLEERLGELAFPPTDEYLRTVTAARDAFHRLTVETHYRLAHTWVCEVGKGSDAPS